MVDSSCKYFFKVIVAQAGSACKESRPFLRKKRTAPGRSFSLYLMRTVMVSTAPPTVAVTVVVPTLAGVIKPSAEMDRTLASATAQVAAASVPETLRRMVSLGLIVQSKLPFPSLGSVVPRSS